MNPSQCSCFPVNCNTNHNIHRVVDKSEHIQLIKCISLFVFMDMKNVKNVRSANRKKWRFRGNQFTNPRITSAKPAENAVEGIVIRPSIHTTASQCGSAISKS